MSGAEMSSAESAAPNRPRRNVPDPHKKFSVNCWFFFSSFARNSARSWIYLIFCRDFPYFNFLQEILQTPTYLILCRVFACLLNSVNNLFFSFTRNFALFRFLRALLNFFLIYNKFCRYLLIISCAEFLRIFFPIYKRFCKKLDLSYLVQRFSVLFFFNLQEILNLHTYLILCRIFPCLVEFCKWPFMFIYKTFCITKKHFPYLVDFLSFTRNFARN